MKTTVPSSICFCLLLLTFCLSASSASFAGSAAVRGRVVSSTGELMTNATAYLLPLNIAVPINQDGEYILPAVEDGPYTIAIVHPGFNFYSTKVVMTFGSAMPSNLVMTPEAASPQPGEQQDVTTLRAMLHRCRVPADADTKTVVFEKRILSHDVSNASSVSSPSERSVSLKDMIQSSAGTGAHADAKLIVNVSMLPNPTSDKAMVQFNMNTDANVMLEIYNIQSGQREALLDLGSRERGSNTEMIDTGNLVAGTYAALVRISTCQYALCTFVKN